MDESEIGHWHLKNDHGADLMACIMIHTADRLPFQAAQGLLLDKDLPPEHQLKWEHLSRHPA